MQAVLSLAAAGVLVLVTWAHYLQAVLVQHLRVEHEGLWREMGCPETWTPMSWRLPPFSPLWKMIWEDDEVPPPDPLSRQLAQRIRIARFVALVLFVIAALAARQLVL